MKKYFKLMRVHQYFKNILVFAPLLFSGQIHDLSKVVASIYAFIVFSLLSSAVYIINDIRDVEKDRMHSEKRNRPIASGACSIPAAWALTGVLIAAVAVLSAICFHSYVPDLFLVIYLASNIGCSFGLKNLPIVDVVILVSGYLLRLLFGAWVTEIDISQWLYLTTIGASFYMGFGKRRNELQREAEGTRKVLKFYSKDF